MSAEDHDKRRSARVDPEVEEHRFDSLARTLASGTMSRREAVRLLGVTLLGGAFASVLGIASADPGGDSACAHFCTQAFPPGPERAQCISQGGRGSGPCYECTLNIGPGPHFTTPQCADPTQEFNPQSCQCECPFDTFPYQCGGVSHPICRSASPCPPGQSFNNFTCKCCPSSTVQCGTTCAPDCPPGSASAAAQ
jgi:hypothetical protein